MTPREEMSPLKRKLYMIGAVFFFILGVLGLFLPILQGFLFLFVSLILFSKGSDTGHRLREKFERRYPQWGGKISAAEDWLNELPGRIKKKFRRS